MPWRELLAGAAALLIAPIGGIIGSKLLGWTLEAPHGAEDWVAWATIELAFATVALAIATFRINRLAAQEIVDGRMREEEARKQERRGWAVDFNRAASRIRNATIELVGIYQTDTESVLLRGRMDGRDPTDLGRERRLAWDQWTATWREVRADYYAYLDLAGASLDRALLNELSAKGVPTVEHARRSQDDKQIIAALAYLTNIVERTMIAIGKAHDLRTALIEIRESDKK